MPKRERRGAVSSRARGGDGDGEVVFDFRLSDELAEALGAELEFVSVFGFCEGAGDHARRMVRGHAGLMVSRLSSGHRTLEWCECLSRFVIKRVSCIARTRG